MKIITREKVGHNSNRRACGESRSNEPPDRNCPQMTPARVLPMRLDADGGLNVTGANKANEKIEIARVQGCSFERFLRFSALFFDVCQKFGFAQDEWRKNTLTAIETDSFRRRESLKSYIYACCCICPFRERNQLLEIIKFSRERFYFFSTKHLWCGISIGVELVFLFIKALVMAL